MRLLRNGANWFARAWSIAFPMPPLDDPTSPQPIANAAALREGAKLRENVDAISDRHVA